VVFLLTDLLPSPSVSLCACVICGKTDEWIRMPFGMVNGVGGGMGVLNGGSHVPRGRMVFGDFPHCFGGVNRHFRAKCVQYLNVHIMETTAWIRIICCMAVKTAKYATHMVQ